MKKLILVSLLTLPIFINAQEIVTLTTPITKPNTTTYHISQIIINVDGLTIQAILVGNNNETLSKTYDNTTVPTGATLLHSLNTGNFSVNSLMKAVYNRLITDGVITGTVSGAPQ